MKKSGFRAVAAAGRSGDVIHGSSSCMSVGTVGPPARMRLRRRTISGGTAQGHARGSGAAWRPARPMPPKRQTQAYLRHLLARHGVAPRHRFGQNFLIDLNIHELIVNAAEVGPGDVVLEVGPGAGALTALMADRGAAVVAVDIDPAMARLAADATAGMPNVRVRNADALARKTA